MPQTTSWILAVWGSAVILIGGILTSYHQPFQTPAPGILALVPRDSRTGLRAIHLLSGGCGCSQTIMRHLLARGPFEGVPEHILIIDGEERYLPETGALLGRLSQEGFPITHIAAQEIPREVGLRGVPLLVFASSGSKAVYIGGYGSSGDRDGAILRQIRSGRQPEPLSILGCAIGSRLRRSADPFHLKY